MRLQAFIGASTALAMVVVLIGAISVLRLVSGIGARTSRTLTELASRQFDAYNFESAARYSLAATNGAHGFLIGYDDLIPRAILEASVLNNRLLRVANPHRGAVETLIALPNGRELITTTPDAAVEIWDSASAELLCVLPIYEKPASNCAASKDIKGIDINTGGPEDENPALAEISRQGDLIFTAKGTTARLWDARTRSLLFQFDHPDTEDISGIQTIAIAPDGQLVATGSLDKIVRLWSAQTGKLVRELKDNNDYVRNVRFSPDGRSILAVGNDGIVRLWDKDSGILKTAIDTHSGRLFTGIFSSTGDRFLTAGDDSYARIWQSASGTLLQTFPGSKGRISSASFSPDGSEVLTVSEDGSANLWNASNGNIVETYAAQVHSAKFSDDGIYVLTLSRDQTVRLWDRRRGTLLDEFAGHSAGINSAIFLPDHRRIATSSDDGTIRIWSLTVGEPKFTLDHRYYIAAVEASLDGSSVVTAGGASPTRVWDSNKGELLRELKGQNGPISSIYLSPNGRRLITGSQDGSIYSWDTQSGLVQNKLSGIDQDVVAIALSPDGSLLAAVSLGKNPITGDYHRNMRVWDLQDGNQIFDLREKEIGSLSFSPDGRVLLVAADDLEFFDARSGAPLRSVKKLSVALKVRFSSDGKLVVGSSGQVVRWLEEDPGILLGGPSGDVNDTDISNDGKYGLIAHEDGIARLWNLADGALVQTFSGHKDRLTVARFLGDGRHMVTGSNDMTARIWDLHSGRQLMILRGHASTISNIIVSHDEKMLITQGFNDDFALVWANPLQSQQSVGLFESACANMLLHDSPTRLSILSSEERASAPSIDPERDFGVPGDVCEPTSSWHQLTTAFQN
jgi:WD40 repeat protein